MYFKKLFTLVFIRNETSILLGLKKRGFGVNKWNGFGGKVEPNEQIIDAAVRELEEECCVIVKPTDLRNIGHLEFTFDGDNTLMEVRVYSTTTFSGVPKETEEMQPKWYPYDQIPFDTMWPDDSYWFPYMLKEKLFYGRFHYLGFDKILNYNIDELQSMEDFYASRNL
ncbi:hypothetical protein ACJJTC_019471 [Scirpophaga incertulas]